MATEKRLIYADDLIAEFEWLQSQVSSERAIDLKDHIQRIKDAPTVEAVEVVHGRWLTPEEYANQGHNGWLYCSECEQPMREFYGWGYCPNCGAKMDGGEDNDHRTESSEGS